MSAADYAATGVTISSASVAGCEAISHGVDPLRRHPNRALRPRFRLRRGNANIPPRRLLDDGTHREKRVGFVEVVDDTGMRTKLLLKHRVASPIRAC